MRAVSLVQQLLRSTNRDDDDDDDVFIILFQLLLSKLNNEVCRKIKWPNQMRKYSVRLQYYKICCRTSCVGCTTRGNKV